MDLHEYLCTLPTVFKEIHGRQTIDRWNNFSKLNEYCINVISGLFGTLFYHNSL